MQRKLTRAGIAFRDTNAGFLIEEDKEQLDDLDDTPKRAKHVIQEDRTPFNFFGFCLMMTSIFGFLQFVLHHDDVISSSISILHHAYHAQYHYASSRESSVLS